MLTTLSILSIEQGKGIDEKWLRQADGESASDACGELRRESALSWWQASRAYFFGPFSDPALPLRFR
jgi:hypothetical protein